MPKVSVIMPSYNKEKYIAKSIESILNQTYTDFELIIIDDVSSDRSVEIIKSFNDSRIVFGQNEVNIGIAANRNKAIDISSGEYIALLDADDLSSLDRLEKEVYFLDNRKDIEVVFGDFDEIDENGVKKNSFFVPLVNPNFIKANLMIKDVIPNGSCMYRKSFIDSYNIRYREDCYGMDDYLFWVECATYGAISSIPDKVLLWRNTSENSTSLYKSSEKYSEKRKEKFSEIQKISLVSNGFDLTDEEFALYARCFQEKMPNTYVKSDVEKLFLLLKKMCKQAESFEHTFEIKKALKQKFGLIMERADVWE